MASATHLTCLAGTSCAAAYVAEKRTNVAARRHLWGLIRLVITRVFIAVDATLAVADFAISVSRLLPVAVRDVAVSVTGWASFHMDHVSLPELMWVLSYTQGFNVSIKSKESNDPVRDWSLFPAKKRQTLAETGVWRFNRGQGEPNTSTAGGILSQIV